MIHYYLVDDTIEVREVHQPNDGRDPFPVLICRQRLSKNRKDIPGGYIIVTNANKFFSSIPYPWWCGF